MAKLHVGISGWTYAPWRGTFYPPGLPHARELAWASQRLNTSEINGTFYSLQRPESFIRWRDQTPPGFIFSIKGSRYITHMLKLRGVEQALANFFASGVLALGDKLGPILWQFPAWWGFDEERWAAFLQMLPRTTRAAVALARKHDQRVEGRSWTRPGRQRRLRYAFEVRHPSFLDVRFITMLRRFGGALVFADTAGRWPYSEDVTADFIYIRLHGSTEIYTSRYTESEIEHWAKRIELWAKGREPRDAVKVDRKRSRVKAKPCDVYVYFDNDVKVHAPFDAIELAQRLGVASAEEPPLRPAAVAGE